MSATMTARRRTTVRCSDRSTATAIGRTSGPRPQGVERLKRSPRADMLRKALADEAARLMIEHGVEDYGLAKRKAAMRLGVSDHAVLPKNAEIEAALLDRQRLFGAEAYAERVESQRTAALAAMRLLQSYEPRLTGAVLAGTSTEHTSIELHLFSDSPEAIVVELLDRGLAHRTGTRRFRASREGFDTYPSLHFTVQGHDIEATVFPQVGLRQPPTSPIDGRPMRRATTLDVELLLASPQG